MRFFIPYGRQWIDKEDISSAVSVLKSDFITQGSKVKEFENKVAKYCGTNYAVAVSSRTAALHIACLAAGIKNSDEVITTPISFVASSNCIIYCGAVHIVTMNYLIEQKSYYLIQTTLNTINFWMNL